MPGWYEGIVLAAVLLLAAHCVIGAARVGCWLVTLVGNLVDRLIGADRPSPWPSPRGRGD